MRMYLSNVYAYIIHMHTYIHIHIGMWIYTAYTYIHTHILAKINICMHIFYTFTYKYPHARRVLFGVSVFIVLLYAVLHVVQQLAFFLLFESFPPWSGGIPLHFSSVCVLVSLNPLTQSLGKRDEGPIGNVLRFLASVGLYLWVTVLLTSCLRVLTVKWSC